MTEEKLNELESACRSQVDRDGQVRLDPGHVLELVSELRALRRHASPPAPRASALPRWPRLKLGLCAHRGRSPDFGMRVGNRIAVQDPGR